MLSRVALICDLVGADFVGGSYRIETSHHRLPKIRYSSSAVFSAVVTPRINYQEAAPNVFQSMLALHMAARRSSLPVELLDLVDYCVSLINGCAFCLDMHSKDLRARGETEQRLYLISAWREVPDLYSPRERAALAWAEAVTRLVEHQVPEEVYEQARSQFSETELAELTLAVISINGWNRINIAFCTPAGDYKPNLSG